MLRAAIIGGGVMGKKHLLGYQKAQGVEIVAMADTSTEARTHIEKLYGIKVYDNYKELIKIEKPDLISVVTPNNTHKEISCYALSRKIHVLVEKPIADDIKDANAIIRTATKNKALLMVGHIERFNPVVSELKKSIDTNEIILITSLRSGPYPERVKSTGVIMDIAIHDIDLLRYLTNSEIQYSQAFKSRNITKYEDAAILIFSMKNGCIASSNVNWHSPSQMRFLTVTMRSKLLRADLLSQQLIEYNTNNVGGKSKILYQAKQIEVLKNDSIKLEIEHFINCIINDQEPLITGSDGVKALSAAKKCESTKYLFDRYGPSHN